MGSGARSSGVAVVLVKPTSEYPCQWDDLIGADGKTLATIYTLQEVVKDGFNPGITKGRDGIYDIVMPVKELNRKIIKKALKNLEEITGTQYVLSS